MSYSFNNLEGYEKWMDNVYRMTFDSNCRSIGVGYVIPKGLLVHYFNNSDYPCRDKSVKTKETFVVYATSLLGKVTCIRCREWLKDNVMLPKMRMIRIWEASGEVPKP